jgi:hypothetical protein
MIKDVLPQEVYAAVDHLMGQVRKNRPWRIAAVLFQAPEDASTPAVQAMVPIFSYFPAERSSNVDDPAMMQLWCVEQLMALAAILSRPVTGKERAHFEIHTHKPPA